MRWLAGILLLLLVVLQYRLWVGEGSLAEVQALRDEVSAQERELEQLRIRNQTLEAEVLDLRKGLGALEERARSELGMIKQGEMFLQVIDEHAGGTSKAPIPIATQEPSGEPGARTAPRGREGDGSARPGAAPGR